MTTKIEKPEPTTDLARANTQARIGVGLLAFVGGVVSIGIYAQAAPSDTETSNHALAFAVVFGITFLVCIVPPLLRFLTKHSGTIGKILMWTIGAIVVLGVITLLDAWRFVVGLVCFGGAAWFVYFIISEAVAAGIRKGRKE